MARARPYSEERWLAEPAPDPLLYHLSRARRLHRLKGGRRRLRLLGCAAARLAWHHLPDDRYRKAVEAAERAAEAEARHADMVAARDRAQGRQAGTVGEALTFAFQSLVSRFGWSLGDHSRHELAGQLVRAVGAPGGGLRHARMALNAAVGLRDDPITANADHARLVRCLFGNPFRAVPFADAWRTPDVVGLARSAYDDGKSCLPILADALEDAGCTDEGALAHLRDGQSHPRGCWVVDAVLGRVIEWPATP